MRKEGKLSPEILERINEMLAVEPDKVFFDLATRIDGRIENSEYWPWMLASKMEPESARVVLALPDEQWEPSMGEFKCSEQFSTRLGMDKDFVEKQLEERFYSGELMWTDHGAVVTPSCGMWIDLQNSRRWFERNGTAYYKVISFFVENEVSKVDQRLAAKMDKEGKMGQARIIPRYDSVKDYAGLLPAENMKEICKSRRVVAQNQCACRIRYPELGLDPYVCMCFNDTAELAIKMEIGREIGWEEAFEYVQMRGKEQPHCHINKHTDNLNNIGDVLCSCQSDVCVLLKNPVALGTEFKPWKYYGKSRFRAVIDPTKCINCNLCSKKRCMFGAIDRRYSKKAKEEKAFVIEEVCMGCGCCAETCPSNAITMVCVEPPEYLLGYRLAKEEDLSEYTNLRPGGDVNAL